MNLPDVPLSYHFDKHILYQNITLLNAYFEPKNFKKNILNVELAKDSYMNSRFIKTTQIVRELFYMFLYSPTFFKDFFQEDSFNRDIVPTLFKFIFCVEIKDKNQFRELNRLLFYFYNNVMEFVFIIKCVQYFFDNDMSHLINRQWISSYEDIKESMISLSSLYKKGLSLDVYQEIIAHLKKDEVFQESYSLARCLQIVNDILETIEASNQPLLKAYDPTPIQEVEEKVNWLAL